MAIPDRPMNFQPMELSLDDYIWLGEWMGGEKLDASPQKMRAFKELLARCTDWTPEEIGQIKMHELRDVLRVFQVQNEAEQAVPFSNASSSATGATA